MRLPTFASVFRGFALGLFLLALASPAAAQNCQPQDLSAGQQKLEIASKTGKHAFDVELALTTKEQATGLMCRKEMADNHGMLFDFHKEQDVSFWMKNTYIALDMIFIRADGTVRRIAANTEPLSERGVPAGGPVRFVLEVNGGTARKLGIEPGDKVTGGPLH